MTETTCRYCSLGITTADGDRCLDATCGMRITIATSITHPEYFAISSTSNNCGEVAALVEYAVCQAAERRWAAATAALTDEQRSSGKVAEPEQIEAPWKDDDDTWMISGEATRELISVLDSLGITYSVN